jgi:uncharacterized membrane protein YfcA
LSPESLIVVLGILFAAIVIKSILGFGESLFAVPLLTLVVGIQVAVPLIALIVAGVTVLMVWRNWRQIDLRAIWRLTLAAMIGIPIGVWGLKQLPPEPITLGLGVVLAVVGLFYLFTPKVKPLQSRNWAFGFGFVSGVLGGAYNMSGAPMTIYGAAQKWQATDFRGTLQGYFAVVSPTIVVNLALTDQITGQVLRLLLYALPVIGIAFALGTYLAERVPHPVFEKALYVVLVVTGTLLIFQNVGWFISQPM